MIKILLLLLCFCKVSFAVKDATGVDIPLKNYKRIISLSPESTELISAFIEKDSNRLVGVSQYSDYPSWVQKIKKIGNYVRPNLELIVSLKPDLIFASKVGNPKNKILMLRKLGLNVFVSDSKDIESIARTVLDYGKVLGMESQANEKIKKFKDAIAELKIKADLKKTVPVFFQLGVSPLVTIGKSSFLNEALELAGGYNIYSDRKENYPRPSREDVISRKPEMILLMNFGKKEEIFSGEVTIWKKSFSKKIIVFHSDELVRPSLRIVDGIEKLREVIH